MASATKLAIPKTSKQQTLSRTQTSLLDDKPKQCAYHRMSILSLAPQHLTPEINNTKDQLKPEKRASSAVLHATKDRIAVFDQIKAIAICMVILLHCAAFIQSSVPAFSSVWYLMVSINAGCRMAVPLFVMVSGAVLMLQWQKSQAHCYSAYSSKHQPLSSNKLIRYEAPQRKIQLGLLMTWYTVAWQRLKPLFMPLLFATLFYSSWQALKTHIQFIMGEQQQAEALAVSSDVWLTFAQQFPASLIESIKNGLSSMLVAGGVYYHLWYLWLYIGLLLLSPLLFTFLFRTSSIDTPPQDVPPKPIRRFTADVRSNNIAVGNLNAVISLPPVSKLVLRTSLGKRKMIMLCHVFSGLYLVLLLFYPAIEALLANSNQGHAFTTVFTAHLQSYSWVTSIPWWFWWPAFLGYFMHGMLNIDSGQGVSIYRKSAWAFGMLTCWFAIYCGYIFEVEWQQQHNWFVGYSFHYVSVWVCMITLLTWHALILWRPYNLRQNSRMSFIVTCLARHSLTIYLSHVVFLEIIQQLWLWFGKPGSHNLLLMSLVVICQALITLCCCIGFIWFLRWSRKIGQQCVKITWFKYAYN